VIKIERNNEEGGRREEEGYIRNEVDAEKEIKGEDERKKGIKKGGRGEENIKEQEVEEERGGNIGKRKG
jgi:hypothetical protein